MFIVVICLISCRESLVIGSMFVLSIDVLWLHNPKLSKSENASLGMVLKNTSMFLVLPITTRLLIGQNVE